VSVARAIAASTESSASEKDWMRSVLAAIAPDSGVSYELSGVGGTPARAYNLPLVSPRRSIVARPVASRVASTGRARDPLRRCCGR
jgi:hypothetical protein